MRPTPSILAVVCLLIPAGNARAHQTLTHNIEVNLHDPARVRVFVTVHAPELPSALAAGADPGAVDAAWLRERTDAELSALFDESRAFLAETFDLTLAGAAPKPPAPDPLFETPAQIRDPAYDNGLPPGCLLVTLEFENPGPPRELELRFSKTAEKRLLLAIARPGKFPEIEDLAPGDTTRVALPEAPTPRPTPLARFPNGLRLAALGVLAVFALAYFVWPTKTGPPRK